jgi:hypothetical protein
VDTKEIDCSFLLVVAVRRGLVVARDLIQCNKLEHLQDILYANRSASPPLHPVAFHLIDSQDSRVRENKNYIIPPTNRRRKFWIFLHAPAFSSNNMHTTTRNKE